ncbi:MAG TPA: bifunctional UDP-N-acetylglucosamine diphosphorylase/glucosamine-1-phosphate N-acetyltransferase GlmU, partial [Azospirillaceae bacterium]|nr:bifunctional UDP-N-acetylglucosamine diphosphorylase/glucosamine-1-phosphate N-acetyltransferase GlmU [Azospirillaceae bacterium]
RRGAGDPAVVVLGMRPHDPGAYGRVVVQNGEVEKIVEYLDATPEERAIDLCNGGLMAFHGPRLFELLPRIEPNNAKGEYYLTDLVQLARSAGHAVRVVEGSVEDVMGVNSRAELAEAEVLLQRRLRRAAMDNGATLIDPDTVWFSWDTRLGRDVVIGPSVFFGPGVTVADRVEIKAFSHLEGMTVGAGATIGPFARLRPGAELAEGVHIGNFVEIKNAKIEAGAKVNHLTYIGDARIGAKANIGAGTITCNYDGFAKHHTDIGAGAFIGSNTALVAPVKIGDGALIGAGSTIAADVPADAIAVVRAEQRVLAGAAAKFRARRKK